MVHAPEMPSRVARSGSPFEHSKRISTEKPEAAHDSANSPLTDNESASPNGELTNGTHEDPQSLPNGNLKEANSGLKKWFRGDDSVKAPAGGPTTPVENEKKSSEAEPTAKGRRDWSDDGYFAEKGTITEGWCSTHVKLEPSILTKQSADGGVEAKPLVNEPETLSEKDPRFSPASNAGSSSKFVDGQLLTPKSSANRASSPASFPQSPPILGVASAPGTLQAPPKLTHRHTLEVPKAAAASLSSNNISSEDAVVTATGRFSPATPTRRRGSLSLARRATRSIHSDMHLDEVPQDEDAARWAEHLKQKRASKRKRKEDEDGDRVVMGTKVDQNHANYVTAYNMLTGIRFTVSRTNAKMDRELTDADFEARHKFSFDV